MTAYTTTLTHYPATSCEIMGDEPARDVLIISDAGGQWIATMAADATTDEIEAKIATIQEMKASALIRRTNKAEDDRRFEVERERLSSRPLTRVEIWDGDRPTLRI